MSVQDLLDLSVKTIITSAALCSDSSDRNWKSHHFSADLSGEIKAEMDFKLDRFIVSELQKTGIKILSEERSSEQKNLSKELRFILDPLDGTYNFIRGLAESAISLALWDGDMPVFGVIHLINERKTYWGGGNLGSFCDEAAIEVSTNVPQNQAVVCTGFPVRLDKNKISVIEGFTSVAKQFGKVRMLGSAATSLINVARGSADYYFEDEIMIWDVAAGLAIVEGSGGRINLSPGSTDLSLKVKASNVDFSYLFDG